MSLQSKMMSFRGKIEKIFSNRVLIGAFGLVVLSGLVFGVVKLVGASTSGGDTVTVASYGDALKYGNDDGEEYSTTYFTVTESSGSTHEATCVVPELATPYGTATVGIVSDAEKALQMKRILLVSNRSYDSVIYDAFDNDNANFWTNLAKNDSKIRSLWDESAYAFVLGHILVSRVYEGWYFAVSEYEDALDAALSTINTWFAANYETDYLDDYNLRIASTSDSNQQPVAWLEVPGFKVRVRKGVVGQKDVYIDGAKFTMYKRGTSDAYEDHDTSFEPVTVTTGIEYGGKYVGHSKSFYLPKNADRYCFVETEAPDGYLLNTTPKCTNSLNSYTTTTITSVTIKDSISETPSGLIRIEKVDSETGATAQGGASLIGTMFQILDASGEEVEKLEISSANGDGRYIVESSELSAGTYTVKEFDAGAGYKLNSSWSKTCKIENSGDVCDYTGSNAVKNDVIKGGFTIKKTDATTGAVMAGVEFDLYYGKKASGTPIKTVTTGSDGTYTLPESEYLPYGRYTLKEKAGSANEHYTLADALTFWIGRDKETQTTDTDLEVYPAEFENIPEEKITFSTVLNGGSSVSITESGSISDVLTFGSDSFFIPGRSYRILMTLYGHEAGGSVSTKSKIATYKKSFQGSKAASTYTGSFEWPSGTSPADFAGGKLWVVTRIQYLDSGSYVDIVRDNEDMDVASEIVDVDDPVYGLSSQACKIGTSGTTCEKSVPVGETGVVDTVDVTQGLISGREYIVRATAVCYTDGQTSGTTLKTADSDSFSSTDGKKTGILIELEFDSSSCTGGKKIGVQNQLFEYSGGSVSGAALVQHNQGLNDSKQTVSVLTPSIVTTASPSGDSATVELGTEVTVNDTINYSGLAKGTNYCLAGKLMRGSTVLAENTKAFKASDESGNQTMSFKFNSTELGGESVTVNEYLYQGACGTGTLIVTHENGSGQTVLIESRDPAISTTASPSSVPLSSSATVNDTISYSGLIGGVQYCLAGKLMDGTTAVKTADKIFTPSAASGRETVSFTFDSSAYEGKSLTVNEYLYKGACSTGELVVTHENGTGQTVTVMEKVPTIGTKASNNGGATNILEPAAGQVIVDKVKYYNLKAGQKYTLFGDLMKSATEKFSSATSGVRVVFTATERDGEVNMTFPAIDATNLAGQSLVVFERLYLGEITSESGTPVAKHEDFSDGDQAVVVKPKVGTKVAESQTLEAKVGIGNAVIIDTIEYEGLVSGQTYIAKGWLVDANGRKIEGSEGTKTFKIGDTETPETSGKVKVSLPLRTVGLGGKKVVAFEEVYLGSTLVAVHKDVNDQGQTLDVLDPALGTEVKDSVDGDKEVAMSSEAKVVDTVSYKGLVIGSKYCVRGVMMDKETGNPVTVEDGANVGNIEGKACFTADRVDGSATVEFAFDASKYGGKTFVVFETLYLVETQDGKEVETSIAKHHNIEDAAQTFTVKLDVPETGRVTSDNSGAKVAAGGVAVIIIGALGYGVYLKRSKRKYSAEA